jgi:hypothetical protein
MAGRVSSGIVKEGLVMAVDASDRLSYPGSGSNVFDLTVNGRTCVLVNTPSVGLQGITLNGTNNYAYVSHGGSLSFNTGNFTVCVWNNELSSASTYGGILSNDANLDFSWKIAKVNTNSFYTVFCNTSTNVNWFANYPSFSVGSFSHYAFTFNSGVIQTYFNGIARNSVSGVSNPASYNNLVMGSYRYDNAVSGLFLRNQIIGPVHLYNRALTSSEISQNFNATRWKFGI